MIALDNNSMAATVGGSSDFQDIVTGTCAVVGVVAVFGGPVGVGAAGFCAGWSLAAAFWS